MPPRVRSWPATYAQVSAPSHVFAAMFGVVAIVAVGSLVGSAQTLDRLQSVVEWLIPLALVPYGLWLVRSLAPRRATVRIVADRLEILRGSRTISLDRSRLQLRARRWSPTTGMELGTVLLLDDGRHRIALGIRDRRVGNPERTHRNPELYVEGEIGDALLAALDHPDATGETTAASEPLTVELRPNGFRLGSALWVVLVMFGSLIAAGLLGFMLASIVPELDVVVWPVVMLAGIVLPQVWMVRRQHGVALRLTVDGGSIVLDRRTTTERLALDDVKVECGVSEHTARYYGDYRLPALRLRFPGREPIAIGTADVRLRWRYGGRTMKAPAFLATPIDFRQLVWALGMDRALMIDRDLEPTKAGRLFGRSSG